MAATALGVINGPPQWQPHREANHASGDSPSSRPPLVQRSTSSQLPPSLPPKQSRPLSHHSTLRTDATPSLTGVTSYPAPPSQPVATVPRRSTSATAATLSGPRSRAPIPARLSRDAGSSDVKTELEDNSSNECAVCLERPPDCVVYTCGHMCMCYGCAHDIRESADASCPICRQPIVDIIKIFRT